MRPLLNTLCVFVGTLAGLYAIDGGCWTAAGCMAGAVALRTVVTRF
jgi:hypothetical protein